MKLILGTILCIYVIASTQLIELAKLPTLYSHYLEHKKENSYLCFTEFISLHYTASQDDFDSKHSNLPFKSCKENTVVSITMPINNLTLELNQVFNCVVEQINFFYKSRYAFQYLHAIWQPPRI